MYFVSLQTIMAKLTKRKIGQIGPIGPIGQIDPIKTTGNLSIKKLGYYMTHDNGGRPYKVVITKLRNKFLVKVYRYVDMDESKPDSHKDYFVFEKTAVFKILAWRVFVACRANLPKSLQHDFRPSDWCDYENPSGDKHMYYDGHVIVCQVASNRFVYIGSTVYRFCTLSKVTALYSYIRGSDVAYACLVDDKRNMYSLIEKKVASLPADVLVDTEDLYQHLYNGLATRDMPVDVLDVGLVRLG